jgi:hypothetical protein
MPSLRERSAKRANRSAVCPAGKLRPASHWRTPYTKCERFWPRGGTTLPEGSSADTSSASTVQGQGARKNDLLRELSRNQGVD